MVAHRFGSVIASLFTGGSYGAYFNRQEVLERLVTSDSLRVAMSTRV